MSEKSPVMRIVNEAAHDVAELSKHTNAESGDNLGTEFARKLSNEGNTTHFATIVNEHRAEREVKSAADWRRRPEAEAILSKPDLAESFTSPEQDRKDDLAMAQLATKGALRVASENYQAHQALYNQAAVEDAQAQGVETNFGAEQKPHEDVNQPK